MKRLGILVLSLIAIGGCSETKIEQSVALDPIPDQLILVPSAKGVPLSKIEIEAIKTHLGSRPTITIPDSSMVFSNKRFSTDAIQLKEAELKAKDKNSYLLIKEIQKNCVKDRPTSNVEATFPANDDIAFENLRTGDRLKANYSAALGGEYCPLKLGLSYKLDSFVERADATKKEGLVKLGAVQSGNVVVLSPKFASLFKTRALVLNSSVSGLNIRQDIKNKFLFEYSMAR